MIVFPFSRQPRVSIIVVTYGRRELVRQALEAVHANTPSGYEVILVDNASPDDTGDWLEREVRGATLLRAPRNLGFGLGANWGAMAAKSPLLCFLNSDAFVHEGWLDPLVRRLSARRGAAAVVPCLLNLDGSLQEAGTVVGSDGGTFAFGYGDDAMLPAYRFARVIDYGSAACLLMRRSAFTRVGGFDAAYGLGYCEDVDLALGLADLGRFTVYEPESIVSHVRHGSSSEGAAAKRVNANRTILVDRWWQHLTQRPSLAELERRPHRVVSLRDAPATDTVLVVTDRIPHPQASDFASVASLRMLLDNAPALRVTLLLGEPSDAEQGAPAYWAAGVEVVWGEEDWAAWLASRRFHYSVVVIEGPDALLHFDPLLRATQPQAMRVDARAAAEVGDALGDPRRRGRRVRQDPLVLTRARRSAIRPRR